MRFRRDILCKMCTIHFSLSSFFVCRMFLSSLMLRNTAYYILMLSGYFWSIFWSVLISTSYGAMLQMWHFTSFLLKFKPSLLVKRVFLFNVTFAVAVLDLISHVHLICYQTRWNIPCSPVVWSLIICMWGWGWLFCDFHWVISTIISLP